MEVLLVDDEPTLLCVLELGLRHLGFGVAACGHPREALTLVEATPGRFSVVVTDLDLPELSGLELADRIRAAAPHVRILLHSGTWTFTDTEGRVDAMLDKPTTLRELARVVSALAATSPNVRTQSVRRALPIVGGNAICHILGGSAVVHDHDGQSR